MKKPASHLILVGEDDADDRLLLTRAFMKHRRTVRLEFAEDGELVISRLGRDEGEQPSIILLDLNMPRLDGREVLRRVKSSAHLRHIPVIILTTSSSDSDSTFCYDCGATAFIVKPSTADGLAFIADAVVSFWFEAARLSVRPIPSA